MNATDAKYARWQNADDAPCPTNLIEFSDNSSEFLRFNQFYFSKITVLRILCRKIFALSSQSLNLKHLRIKNEEVILTTVDSTIEWVQSSDIFDIALKSNELIYETWTNFQLLMICMAMLHKFWMHLCEQLYFVDFVRRTCSTLRI